MKEFTIKERVFVVAAILVYTVCCAYGDTKITWLADVTADRAETVTGVQSNQIANAAAHINRTDNPHGVTAAQVGALTNETDEAALAAMPFNLFDATKNVIWKGAGTNANTTQSVLIGDRAGNAATGSTIIAIGRDAARDILNPASVPETELSIIAIGENAAEQAGGGMGAFSYNIAIGNSAFKEGNGQSSIAIGQDAFDKSVGVFTSIAIGREAGRTAAAEHMIAIGYQAGEQAGLTNSVAIGANAGRRASGQNILVIDSSGNDDSSYPTRAMIYGNANDLTLGRIDSDNNLRGNWLFNNNQILTNEQDLAALRAYHYGSPDIVESPAEWFNFDGAGTILGYNFAAGRENVVIPWAIGGVPVTAIGARAFAYTSAESVIAPQTVTMTGEGAFVSCILLTSINLPQATSIGDSTFSGCSALTSVTVPQVTSIGEYAFAYCSDLTSVNLPQATAIGDYAFYYCLALTAVRMGQNAPAEAADVFADIGPPPTVYVTDPQATGWGAEWNGAPVVRPPLYASSVTAQAFTLNGDTITEWPAGGGETSIIAPLYESGTNVVVTSTQSVYSVSVTDAGPVGIDWSGLALDGTGRAEVTLRLNVTEWGGTNVTFAPSLTFDRAPEILVTGVWEFAASTIDGVTTRVSQTWPECCGWQPVVISVAGVSLTSGAWWQMPVAATNFVYWQAVNQAGLVRMRVGILNHNAVDVYLYSSYAEGGHTTFSALDVFQSKTVSFPSLSQGEHTVSIAVPQPVYPNRGVKIWVAPVGEVVRINNFKHRDFNSNERAAYDAGWRP